MKTFPKTLIIGIVSILIAVIAIVVVAITISKGSSKDVDPTIEASTQGVTNETTEEQKTENESTTETTVKEETQATTEKTINTTTSVGAKVLNVSGALPSSDRVDSSYWAETVFVGDSVSNKLQYSSELKGATFLCKANFSVVNALDGVVFEHIENDIANSGKKRVYIMLGMNDLNRSGVDGTVAKYKELVQKILKKNPNCLIYIQSMTPITGSKDGTNGKTLTNANISLYNQKLSAMANENGWYYVDVASAMYNGSGNLKDEYCGDNVPEGMGLHLSATGVNVWVDYLSTHAYDPSWSSTSEETTKE